MKITAPDYATLQAACVKVLDSHPNAKAEYAAANLAALRTAWDVLYATKLKIGDGKGVLEDINLYAYLNDDHITTALLRIVKEHKPQ